MRVLLDHCVPRSFRKHLPAHNVATTQEMGWADLDNGDLLQTAAQDQFDAFVTVDQNIQFQHNVEALPLPVIILSCQSNRVAALKPFAPVIDQILATISGTQMIRIDTNLAVTIIGDNSP